MPQVLANNIMSVPGKTAATPIMIQYQTIKDQHQDAVLFFRLGDFYEMFDTDAVEVSRLLNLTLTHRGDSPMCGIPYHASKIYIARLLRLGKRIAICEQVGAPSQGKGLTERRVVEVITPGTVLEEDYLERGADNFLAALWADAKKTVVGYACLDVSTGVFFASSWKYTEMTEQFTKEFGRTSPRELLVCQSLASELAVKQLLESTHGLVHSFYPDWHFAPELSYKRLCEQFKTIHLRAFSLTEHSGEVPPAGFLIGYASKNAGTALVHINSITITDSSEYVIIDDSTRRNLELTANLRDGSSQYTLLETVNHTVTPMGSRLLRSWLLSPLTDAGYIRNRQEQTRHFYTSQRRLEAVRACLAPILDLERLASRIAMERAHAKDLAALRSSLSAAVNVFAACDRVDFSAIDTVNASEIVLMLENAILDDPSTIFTEGRLIKRGWSEHLDRLHEILNNFSAILEKYLEEERQKTGIQNLKIRFNRNDGYYIEVTKGKLDAVPEHFIKRRSLVSGERYTTERLALLEKELTSAGENIVAEEQRLFLELRASLVPKLGYIFSLAAEIARIDTLASFAYTARKSGWICPEIDEGSDFDVVDGRHPVVELHLPSNEFVPNDLSLGEKTFALITGPNMAGKSTYLRQNALIVLLAQTGSFVPAKKARIGLIDRIFCRVGASDNLARGESTFLVEMTETAHILRSATKRSLVIMDEVGRGTSTEDGLSIAWAVSEYLLNNIQAKTLFATHYHELTRIAHPKLILLCLSVLENEGSVVFLKRIKEGAVENSYGLHVAQMAGIPSAVLTRAYEILDSIQKNAPHTELEIIPPKSIEKQAVSQKTVRAPGLFSDEELILDEILSIETDSITPLEALQKLARWKKALLG